MWGRESKRVTLPVEVVRALKRSRQKDGFEQFHGTTDVPLAQSVLAGAVEPTALRDRRDLQLNSLSNSCAGGVKSADCPGVGRVVGFEGETAQGAEDSWLYSRKFHHAISDSSCPWPGLSCMSLRVSAGRTR